MTPCPNTTDGDHVWATITNIYGTNKQCSECRVDFVAWYKCANTTDGEHVWETLEDGRTVCFECDTEKEPDE